MQRNFGKLSYQDLAFALKSIAEIHDVYILDEVMIAEANIFLCKFNERRFNVYFDLTHGAEIKSVDKMEDEELKLIEELILAEVS